MDPYSKYKRQLEYYEYLEKQKENYIDLTKENNAIKQFAEILFNKSKNNLSQDLTGIIFDDSQEPVDIFCILVELVLYGINILTDKEHNLFELKETTDDMVYLLKSYFKSTGFDMIVREELIDPAEINLYRDRNDYYCHITKKPPDFLCMRGWYILEYRLCDNKKFKYTNLTPLENFKAFFITKEKKLFTFNFKLAI